MLSPIRRKTSMLPAARPKKIPDIRSSADSGGGTSLREISPIAPKARRQATSMP